MVTQNIYLKTANMKKYLKSNLKSLDFNLIPDNGEPKSIVIHDVYKTETNSKTILNVLYGKWDSNSNLSVIEPDIWKRRSDLHGHNLR